MSLANSGSSPSDLTLPPKTPPPPPKLDASWDRVCACSFGHYPWDDWKRWALAQGLDAKVAGQARLLIREAFNHAWEGWLQIICGWDDDGLALFEFGRRAPEKALRQWNVLMRTDGFRGDIHPETRAWTWGYLRFDAGRLHDRLLLQATIYTLSRQPLPEPKTDNAEP
jgi:hypothetical protein